MTNYENIMSDMTVDRLAQMLAKEWEYKCDKCKVNHCIYLSCHDNVRIWLESEVNEDDKL